MGPCKSSLSSSRPSVRPPPPPAVMEALAEKCMSSFSHPGSVGRAQVGLEEGPPGSCVRLAVCLCVAMIAPFLTRFFV